MNYPAYNGAGPRLRRRCDLSSCSDGNRAWMVMWPLRGMQLEELPSCSDFTAESTSLVCASERTDAAIIYRYPSQTIGLIGYPSRCSVSVHFKEKRSV